MLKQNSLTHLLWTGGWDSTFRLLQLLVQNESTVQPHYLIDPRRKSIGDEISAMDFIKEKIKSQYPQAANRLCPTKYMSIVDLPRNMKLIDAHVRLLKRFRVGSQYEWLANYCQLSSLQNVEIALTTGSFSQHLRSLSIILENSDKHIYRLDSQYQETDEYILFQTYCFPLFDTEKLSMQKIAVEQGWMDIMQSTWFCHSPLPNHTPCGMCRPCSFVIERGLSWRMPALSILRYYITLRPLVYNNSRLYRMARQIRSSFS